MNSPSSGIIQRGRERSDAIYCRPENRVLIFTRFPEKRFYHSRNHAPVWNNAVLELDAQAIVLVRLVGFVGGLSVLSCHGELR